MTELAQPFLAPWASFFTMTATAAATLIGLMFVVVTLVSGIERTGDSEVGLSTFSTPTVIHFGAALLVSAILIAPWPRLAGAFVLVTLVGLAGVAHMSRVTGKARRLTAYAPDMEDWLWYTILPFVAYASVLAGALSMPLAPGASIWILGGTTTLLIFMGIRNAWDVVTYLTMERIKRPEQAPPPASSSQPPAVVRED
ncbi:MAG TPA: hypothetical protein VFO25_05360 [Candidatus Eremiobacteraceae bacterium]|nr:hypothetical protein [Candidatus Eremiobacteraceae bacterium]